MAAAALPSWTAPPEPSTAVQSRMPRLAVYNSLTKSKKPFVPGDAEGKRITWYACGPTVYDDAHLGHARNYVSTDIIRRILRDYFKFDVQFVMNITDVDDKIILAARQKHFLQNYISEHPTVEPTVVESVSQAFQAYVLVQLPLLANDLTLSGFPTSLESHYGHVLKGKSLANDGSPAGDKEAKLKMHITIATSAHKALSDTTVEPTQFYALASGVLLPFLDTKYKTTIDSKDHSIFTTLTKEYERRFFDDMAALNVQRPEVITRVTEYGPQIVEFVKRIQENGFAYEHEGSVYYDVKAWEASGGVYARLEPWSKNDKDLQADGEGALQDKTVFKKSAADFALWKASKPGEPGWDSPWGVGRPGWHIECSAMASDVLGQQFDIHSGGIDLAFPHHDNELAQSEAYWAKAGEERKQWVNYFLHMGHLSIQGAKMSKSLKNFTTIKEALARGDWTPRSLRIAYLLGNWRDGLEITPEVISGGLAWEDKLTNFFLKARDLEKQSANKAGTNGHAADATGDATVQKALETAKARVHDALCDSFDTPLTLRIMSEVVTVCNSEKAVSDSTTLDLARWLTSIVNVFGLDAAPVADGIGWSGIDIPESAKPYIYAVAKFRDEVRKQAIEGAIKDPAAAAGLDQSLFEDFPPIEADSQQYQSALVSFRSAIEHATTGEVQPKVFLQLCDRLRDDTLWNLGIYLEDRENLPALVRPLTASLRAERDNREALAALKLKNKAEAKEKAEREARERLEKGRLSPADMFRTEEYSAWDEDGLPTRDKVGADVAKSKLKKLKRDWERQKKLHEDWKAAQPAA